MIVVRIVLAIVLLLCNVRLSSMLNGYGWKGVFLMTIAQATILLIASLP